jgi:hypothetical protein
MKNVGWPERVCKKEVMYKLAQGVQGSDMDDHSLCEEVMEVIQEFESALGNEVLKRNQSMEGVFPEKSQEPVELAEELVVETKLSFSGILKQAKLQQVRNPSRRIQD